MRPSIRETIGETKEVHSSSRSPRALTKAAATANNAAADREPYVGLKKPAEFMDYLAMTRPDYWLKNIFVLPGILFALAKLAALMMPSLPLLPNPPGTSIPSKFFNIDRFC